MSEKSNVLKKFKFVPVLWCLMTAVFIATTTYMAYIVFLRHTSQPGLIPPFKMSNEPEIVLALQVTSLLGLILPIPILRKLRIKLPPVIPALWIVFIFCTMFLGEVCGCYHLTHYDKILHAIAAFTIGILGFLVIDLINKPKSVSEMRWPFVAMFAFGFSFTINVFWEIFEFTMDTIFADSNMQRYMVAPGYPFIGRDALLDTMLDIIIAAIGASLAVGVVYVCVKRRPNWLERSQLRRDK